ncbi:Rhodanese-like domain-containing protein [Xylariaceae sp. FL0255]|nr:Rhodanese-like domain-containing protein [Xylariaceae sp. FL0255]
MSSTNVAAARRHVLSVVQLARPSSRSNSAAAPSLRAALSSAPTRSQTAAVVAIPQWRTQISKRARQTYGIPARSSSMRWSTTSATGSKIWTFEEIQTLSSSSPSGTTIIDVREPGELQQTGRIPGALNIPITTSPDAFHLSAEEFEDRFGFAQPEKEDEVVFYCKAGVRSRAAAGIAREAGWTNVGEFPGSWLEWSGKGGEVER